MKLYKYEHACFVMEKDGVSIVVDPGTLTHDFTMPDAVSAIIITHNHPDHFDEELVSEIASKHPAVTIIAPLEITKQLKAHTTKAVTAGDNFTIDGFELEFFGGSHAPIYSGIETPTNLGVMIEERLYYPGDSFEIPEKSVDSLLLPVGAPWLKIADSIEFLKAIGPRKAYPTHDGVLSLAGRSIVDSMVTPLADSLNISYERIDEHVSIE